jgi:hypothetical protein
MEQHVKFQSKKRRAIEDFEDVVISHEEYDGIVGGLQKYDSLLVNVSSNFAKMTREAKRIIDEAKAKSE